MSRAPSLRCWKKLRGASRSVITVINASDDVNGDLKDQRIYIFQVQKVGDELAFVQVPQ